MRVGVVTEAWARIEEWLAWHTQAGAAALAPPAGPADIAAAEAALGLAFPPELVESLRRHDGQRIWANILPEGPPLSATGIVDHWRACMDVAASFDGLTPHRPGAEPWWHERWVPFAAEDGDAQVIDLRPGPGYGRVGCTAHDGLGDFDAAWPTLGTYLTEVADALAAGIPVRYWLPYLTVDGELWWSTENPDVVPAGARRFVPTI